MDAIKAIISNTFFQIAARIITSGSSFVIAIIIARHFGVLGYGDYAKITAFVGLFYLLSDLGFNAIFLQQNDAKTRFKELLYLRFFIALFLIIVLNLISATLPYNPIANIGYSPSVKIGILIFSLTLLTESTLYSSSVIFQQKLTYHNLLFAGFVGSIVGLGLVSIFSFMGLPFLFILLALVIGGIAESGMAIYYTEEKILPAKIDFTYARKLFIQTLPMAMLLIFNMVYFRVDETILAMLRQTQDVAFYDLAYKFFDFLIALPLFLSNVLYPSLLEDEKNNRSVYKKLDLYLLSFFTFGILVAVPVWIFAPLLSLIKLEFAAAATPLRILVISLPVFFMTSILQWIFIAKKQLNFLVIVYGALLICNVLLNLAFIPRFGYIASATITDVLEVVVLLLFLYKAHKEKEL